MQEKVLQEPQKAQEHLGFYFKNSVAGDPALLANTKMKVDLPTAKKSLEAAVAALESFEKFNDQSALKAKLMEVVAQLGFKNGQVLWPMRVALTGEAFSPGVFEVLWALGKEMTLNRLKIALKNL